MVCSCEILGGYRVLVIHRWKLLYRKSQLDWMSQTKTWSGNKSTKSSVSVTEVHQLNGCLSFDLDRKLPLLVDYDFAVKNHLNRAMLIQIQSDF